MGSVTARLNWLRAGVLGANDGIISTAGLVIGVAAASTSASEIATAGTAGLVAGAISMALGEYVSVSSQRDSERSLIELERLDLETMPEVERDELVENLRERGLSEKLAVAVADELSETDDALRTHLDVEFGIRQEELANPWAAGAASALAFSVGAALPLVAILLAPAPSRIPVTVGAVIIALLITGVASARLGNAPKGAAVVRLVVGGMAAMAVTFGIGYLLGAAI